MLDDFADASNVGGPGGGVGVDDAEAEVGLEEGVHHHTVAKFEDLKGEDGAGEEDKRQGKEGELDDVIGLRGVSVVLLGGGGGAAAQGVGFPPPLSAGLRWSEKITDGFCRISGI